MYFWDSPRPIENCNGDKPYLYLKWNSRSTDFVDRESTSIYLAESFMEFVNNKSEIQFLYTSDFHSTIVNCDQNILTDLQKIYINLNSLLKLNSESLSSWQLH